MVRIYQDLCMKKITLKIEARLLLWKRPIDNTLSLASYSLVWPVPARIINLSDRLFKYSKSWGMFAIKTQFHGFDGLILPVSWFKSKNSNNIHTFNPQMWKCRCEFGIVSAPSMLISPSDLKILILALLGFDKLWTYDSWRITATFRCYRPIPTDSRTFKT